MAIYLYRCPKHGEMELDHPMAEVYEPHPCPMCGATLRRVLTPLHRFWPSNYRPGFEDSGQAEFLDPGYQARAKDKLAELKEDHKRRESRSH